MTDKPLPEKANSDLHHMLALAVIALVGARAAVEARSTPEHVAQLKAFLDGGAQLALAIRVVDGVAHIEFAVLPGEHREFFGNPLLRFSGPAVAALAPPEAVTVFDRGKMN